MTHHQNGLKPTLYPRNGHIGDHKRVSIGNLFDMQIVRQESGYPNLKLCLERFVLSPYSARGRIPMSGHRTSSLCSQRDLMPVTKGTNQTSTTVIIRLGV